MKLILTIYFYIIDVCMLLSEQAQKESDNKVFFHVELSCPQKELLRRVNELVKLLVESKSAFGAEELYMALNVKLMDNTLKLRSSCAY